MMALLFSITLLYLIILEDTLYNVQKATIFLSIQSKLAENVQNELINHLSFEFESTLKEQNRAEVNWLKLDS